MGRLSGRPASGGFGRGRPSGRPGRLSNGVLESFLEPPDRLCVGTGLNTGPYRNIESRRQRRVDSIWDDSQVVPRRADSVGDDLQVVPGGFRTVSLSPSSSPLIGFV